MIKNKSIIDARGMEIDLTGPQGNAYFLMATAKKLSKQLDLNEEEVLNEMKAGDYDNLVDVFEKHFGMVVTLYR